MSNYRGFNVETVTRSNTIRVLSKLFGMKAYAEEGEENTDTNTPAPTFDFEKMIALARKEEKEKLYPRIKKLEEENRVLTANNNANLLEVARLKDELETAKANADGKEDSKTVKDLTKKIVELEAELKEAKESKPDESAIEATIEAKYKAEYEVKSYLTEKVNENKDNILPTLAKKITGKTKEEVDTAIQNAIDETLETKKALGLIDEEGNPIETAKKKQKTEKPPIANPSGSKDKEYDLDYIRNLDPRSKEYQEYRKSIGLK